MYLIRSLYIKLLFLLLPCSVCLAQENSVHQSLHPFIFKQAKADKIETMPGFFRAKNTHSGAIGLMNQNKKIIVPIDYTSLIPPNKEGYIIAINPLKKQFSFYKETTKSNFLFHIFHISGQRINLQLFCFDNGPDDFIYERARYIKNGKMGWVNKKMQIVLPAKKYDFITPLSSPYKTALVFQKNTCAQPKADKEGHLSMHDMIGKWGMINHQGQEVVPLIYDHFDIKNDTLSFLKQDKKLKAYIDAKGYIHIF